MSKMSGDFQDETLRVVVNQEEQFSIWPVERDLPAGWNDIGFTGNKEACLDYIKKIWTDMRPLSLRQHMKELDENTPKPHSNSSVNGGSDPKDSYDDSRDIVDYLSTGDHPLTLDTYSGGQGVGLEPLIHQGYVVIRFLDTRGHTALGIRLERDRCVLDNCDFSKHEGKIRLVGTLILNDSRVRCTADLNLEDGMGTGHLDRL